MYSKSDRLVTLAIAAVMTLTIGFFGSRALANMTYKGYVADLEEQNQKILAEYSTQVDKETDINKLTQRGLHLVETNQPEMAIIVLKHATELDQNYRDSWLSLGYAYLKNNQPNEAVTSLKKAEEIDPIHPQTYEYLVMAYRGLGDEDSAQKASEKYDFLMKNINNQ